MKKTMNTPELTNHLYKMAEDSALPYYIVTGIINCIIRFYNITDGFYEEHAISVFRHFLETQELNFSITL